MTDINAIVQGSLQQMFDSGKVNELIEKQLEHTIKEIINGTLREYSDFGKALRKAIEANLPTEFDSLSLSNYNQFIADTVGRKLQQLASEDWQKEITGLLDTMFEPFQAELKVSDLCKMVQKHFRESIDCSCDAPESFTFIVEQEGSFLHIFFDEDSDKEKYRCKYSLMTMRQKETGLYEVHSVRVDDEDPKKKLFKGPYYHIEKVLMALFYGKTKLVLDVTDSHDLDTTLVDYD